MGDSRIEFQPPPTTNSRWQLRHNRISQSPYFNLEHVNKKNGYPYSQRRKVEKVSSFWDFVLNYKPTPPALGLEHKRKY